ncbi:MAG: hypothetical protein A2W17_04505 [Planctomycetes bacterium RBG_16_41_13]|nr:MAG: hypothetical protein A2W17_04505 [Planctomycetes bacterium RBG_16_41_13]
MKTQPILIDLFCGGGCAAYGYLSAGFFVIGIDIKSSKNYPSYNHTLDYLTAIKRYDNIASAYHASPPCQMYSKLKGLVKKDYNSLLEPVREALKATGKPYIIENVPGASMTNIIKLNGTMFNLKCVKERWFESNCLIMQPERYKIKGKCYVPGYGIGVTGYVSVVGNNFTNAQGKMAMQVTGSMTNRELAEGIPPAYTKFIGEQLINYV